MRGGRIGPCQKNCLSRRRQKYIMEEGRSEAASLFVMGVWSGGVSGESALG